jgi:hypothetical protein
VARASLQATIGEVAARDPVLARLIDRIGPIAHRPRDPDGPFGALVRAIVYHSSPDGLPKLSTLECGRPSARP